MGTNGLGCEVEKSEVSEGQTDMLIFGIFVDFFKMVKTDFII